MAAILPLRKAVLFVLIVALPLGMRQYLIMVLKTLSFVNLTTQCVYHMVQALHEVGAVWDQTWRGFTSRSTWEGKSGGSSGRLGEPQGWEREYSCLWSYLKK